MELISSGKYNLKGIVRFQEQADKFAHRENVQCKKNEEEKKAFLSANWALDILWVNDNL